MNENVSLSDIAALMKNNGGLDGSYGLWLVVFIILCCGGWGNGFGGNNNFANAIGYENLATSNEVQRGFDNQNSMANQRDILAAVNSGTAQAVAATNQTFHDTWNMLSDKYSELQRDISNVALQAQSNQANQQQCCTNVLRAIDGSNYSTAMGMADLKQEVINQGNLNRQMMQEDKIDRLERELAQANGTISQMQQTANFDRRFNSLDQQLYMTTKYPNPNAYSYSAGPNPFCNCNCAA